MNKLPDADAYAIIGDTHDDYTRGIVADIPPDRWVLLVDTEGERKAVPNRPRLVSFVGSSRQRISEWLRAFFDSSGVDDIVVVHNPNRQPSAFYETVNEDFSLSVNRRRIEVATLVKFADQMEENAINNLPAIAASAGVDDFRGAFAGIPAIVCGAGPSLTGDIPEILALHRERKAVIIAVGKAYDVLRKAGIVPEFVAHLDMTPAGSACMRSELGFNGTTLLYDPDAYHGIVRKYPGSRVTFETNTPVVARFVQGFTSAKGVLEKGMSVAHTAFFFAAHTGANPIVLSGVDLAFPSDRTHASGTPLTWGGNVADIGEDFVDVPAANGGRVRSCRSFVSFVTTFEGAISRASCATVINCTNGGAAIRGAIHMRLDEAVKHGFFPQPHSIGHIIGKALASPREFDRAGFLSNSERVLNDLDAVIKVCQECLKRTRRLTGLDADNRYDSEQMRRELKKIGELQAAMVSMGVMDLFHRLISETAVRVKANTKKKDAPGIPKLENNRLALENLRLFFGGYQKAASRLFVLFRQIAKEIAAEKGVDA